jgi:acyl-coenzyme A thioesterase PaaI-like protein
MVVTAGEGMTVSGVFTVTEHHQGAPGLAHGGLLSAAIDEVLGSLNWLIGVPAVTGRLACNFRKPVPVGSVLTVVAQIEAVHGRKVFTSATAYLGSKDQQHIAITATALFVQVQIEHFLNNGNQTEVEAAVADRKSRWGDMAASQTGNPHLESNPPFEFEVNP